MTIELQIIREVIRALKGRGVHVTQCFRPSIEIEGKDYFMTTRPVPGSWDSADMTFGVVDAIAHILEQESRYGTVLLYTVNWHQAANGRFYWAVRYALMENK